MSKVIKVKQKLGMDVSKVLLAQHKASGVPIVSKIKQGAVVTIDNVLPGRIEQIHNLGQKIEVHLSEAAPANGNFRFEKITGSYYLVQQ